MERKLAFLAAANEELRAENDKVAREREEYRKLYLQMFEVCKRLEAGIVGQKREHLSGSETQLSLALLGQLLGDRETEVTVATSAPVKSYERQRPPGRKPLPEHLPRIDIEVLPPEVKQQGLDAFEFIGEDVTETVERRPASLVVVRTHKPKFVAKERDRLGETEVLQASTPELPIERALAGPGLLADTVVRRWQDHLPLNRLEKVYGREGLALARSTLCGWHSELAELLSSLIKAMWKDALTAPYLCTDATGVLVQASEKCRTGHFWVVLAPGRHVLFGYSPKHDSAAIDRLLGGYEGKLVADAHAVYDHLYREDKVIEVGCWAHARRYFYKALDTDPERARKALALIGELFRIERQIKESPPSKRLEVRSRLAAPVVKTFFKWCDAESLAVLDETPIAKGIGYARNQRKALEQFLADGRLPIHNNSSERELRREAVGRKNWLFVGSDEGGEVNATFVTLLASCQLHGLEPWAYLRDLFCLLPSWQNSRVLDLAPAYFKQTLEKSDAQARLDANVFRQATIANQALHPQSR